MTLLEDYERTWGVTTTASATGYIDCQTASLSPKLKFPKKPIIKTITIDELKRAFRLLHNKWSNPCLHPLRCRKGISLAPGKVVRFTVNDMATSKPVSGTGVVTSIIDEPAIVYVAISDIDADSIPNASNLIPSSQFAFTATKLDRGVGNVLYTYIPKDHNGVAQIEQWLEVIDYKPVEIKSPSLEVTPSVSALTNTEQLELNELLSRLNEL